MASPEPELDCRACGACCRQASDGRILVSEADLVRWRRSRPALAERAVPGHFGFQGLPSRSDGACAYLRGTECSVYPDRPDTCRDFAPGTGQCLEFRRAAGLG